MRIIAGRRFIDIMEGANPRRVEIEVGISNGGETEVSGPVREGQQVIISQ